MSKALLIKSYTTKTTGTQGKWNNLDDAPSYIQGIETGKILEDITADKLSALISGVPTPWARARLFKFAMQTISTPDPNIEQAGLTQFYQQLLGEWKGLVAIIALYPDRIRFSAPVYMDTKGKDYNITSAFGRMLFEDKKLWSDPNALSKDPDAQPFIQLIYYRDQLVGGTSPLTGVFTGVDYANLADATDINWYRNGKFEDPTSFLSPDQRQKVYLFVHNMNTNLEEFESKINVKQKESDKPLVDIKGFKDISRDWEKDLNNGGTLRDKGPVAQYKNLSAPFSILFHSNVPVYLKPDYTFTYTNDGNYILIGEIQELLSADNYVIGWPEDSSEHTKLSDALVFFLQVQNIQDGSTCYFTIPLSEKGIDIFKNNLGSLLGYKESGNTRLSAAITDAGQLAVSLVVEIDGERVALNTREYKITWLVEDPGKVIMWPNFTSEKWNKYYLYSEFTTGAKEQFLPIFKWKGQILKTIDGKFWTADYEPIATEKKEVEVKSLITYPSNVGEDLPKYQIISTNKPMMGLSAMVKDTGKDVHAGFLIFRSGQDKIEDFTSIDLKETADVGVDFGSNNTCVYYKVDNRNDVAPVKFKNYRAVLIGRENKNPLAIAENDELLFFTNFESDNGQVKSWLHEHDSRYNCYNESEAIAGGVPVNRPNVLVKKMDQYEITTQAGILHYNMKWLDDDKGRQKKRAFLKTIWLQTCAYLYTNKIRPSRIYWSYPGSMMEPDINEIGRIFDDLCKNTPIIGSHVELAEQRTEAEAVCSFAQSQKSFGLNQDNMFLGIDVGGSTSDIILLAKDPNNGNSSTLYRESSVRLAAGVFFDAVIKSQSFRQALVSFLKAEKTDVRVGVDKDKDLEEEILDEPSKAPYYLNNIFDQLKTPEEYDEFYQSIDANARFVFTIPAYVTGLLLFYSGMLIGKTIKSQHLEHIKRRIDILPFGKGGRLFHWLPASAGSRATNEYYARCVNEGVKSVMDINLEITYRDAIKADNKAEVAKGLCDPQEIEMPKQYQDSDICGETGVRFTGKDGSSRELCIEDELTGDYFANQMNNFDFSGAETFKVFMNIFIDFVSQKTKLYPKADAALREDLEDLPNRVASYICNSDNEYRKARKENTNGFHYHQPIIIAEGLCFLNTLIKKVFNQ